MLVEKYRFFPQRFNISSGQLFLFGDSQPTARPWTLECACLSLMYYASSGQLTFYPLATPVLTLYLGPDDVIIPVFSLFPSIETVSILYVIYIYAVLGYRGYYILQVCHI